MRTMGRKWTIVAAGLAVAAAAGCSSTAIHAAGSAAVPAKQVAAVQQAAAASSAQQARLVNVNSSGSAAFRHWWVNGGYRQYQRVASDLSRLIIVDVLRDQDGAWIADSKDLIADATTASRHLPPVDAAGYRAGMLDLAQAGRDSLGDSFDKAFAEVQLALPKLAAFNHAISGWVTASTPA
jgi:hypothetical protein